MCVMYSVASNGVFYSLVMKNCCLSTNSVLKSILEKPFIAWLSIRYLLNVHSRLLIACMLLCRDQIGISLTWHINLCLHS